MIGCPLEDAWSTPATLQANLTTIKEQVDSVWEDEVAALNSYEESRRRQQAAPPPQPPTQMPSFRGYTADGSFHGDVRTVLKEHKPSVTSHPKEQITEGFEPAPIQSNVKIFDFILLYIIGCLLMLVFENMLHIGIHFQRIL